MVVAAAPGRASCASALKASADTEARQTNVVAKWPFMAVFPLVMGLLWHIAGLFVSPEHRQKTGNRIAVLVMFVNDFFQLQD